MDPSTSFKITVVQGAPAFDDKSTKLAADALIAELREVVDGSEIAHHRLVDFRLIGGASFDVGSSRFSPADQFFALAESMIRADVTIFVTRVTGCSVPDANTIRAIERSVASNKLPRSVAFLVIGDPEQYEDPTLVLGALLVGLVRRGVRVLGNGIACWRHNENEMNRDRVGQLVNAVKEAAKRKGQGRE